MIELIKLKGYKRHDNHFQ